MDWLADPQVYASLVTLIALEVVLGIDNLVFIALLVGRLPFDRQHQARQLGLALALITRLVLLGSIAWVIGLTRPLFFVFGHVVSWRDIVLASGGLFLLYKGTMEIHHRLEDDRALEPAARGETRFASVIVQIMVLDAIFSLDSVITAVGMASEFWVMAFAITFAVVIMLVTAKPLAGFIDRHPTVKMLALSFLLLIGMALIADGAGFHVPKGYIYAAIGFSIGVEALNQIAESRRRWRGRLREPGAAMENAAPKQPVVRRANVSPGWQDRSPRTTQTRDDWGQ